MLTNVPRIRDVEVLLELMRGSARRSRASARRRCGSAARRSRAIGPIRCSSASCAARCCCSVRCSRDAARRGSRRQAETFRRGARSPRTCRRSSRMGAVPLDEPGHALDAPNGLTGASFYLDEASVTGTETALLAAAAAKGRTEIRHAAMEPHVVELCRFLRAMGVGDRRARERRRSASKAPARFARRRAPARRRLHRSRAAGAWSRRSPAATSRSPARARADLEVVAAPLRKMGLRLQLRRRPACASSPSPLTAARRITTGLWPGFPSDMVSLVTVLATQADGRTLVHDWLYELRLFALEQLSAMRADLFLCDPHRIIVSGPTKLRGRMLDSRDLRSGMALIAAALAAEGESRVDAARDRRARLRVARRAAALARRAGRARRITADSRPLDSVLRPGGSGFERAGRAAAAGLLRRRRRDACPAAALQRLRERRAPAAARRARGHARAGSARRAAASGAAAVRRPPPLPESRPSRNGRRSLSDRSSTRTMCGVSVRMMSVCCVSLWLLANSRPMSGRSLRPGTPDSTVRSSSRISPASMFVSPSFSRIVVLISRLPNVGSPPKPVARDAAQRRSSAPATPRRRGACAA